MATWPCFTAIGRSWGEEWPVSLGHGVMYNWFRYALFSLGGDSIALKRDHRKARKMAHLLCELL